MKIIRILNLVTLIATITINGLANALPINGLMTGEISDSFGALFTPAGYVFAIWGVIYIALTIFGIYQVLPSQKNNERIDRIGIWFILANLFNGSWILAWHYQQFILSLAIMLALLISLLVIYTRLKIGISKIKPAERWLMDTPFSIYLGWISVATIANVSVVLIDINWNGFGISATIWTVLMIAVATILGIIMTARRNEAAYTLVLVWALVGIFNNGSGNPAVTYSALAAAILLFIAIFAFRIIINRRRLMARFN
jgi:benzodiazapine receptor